MSSAAATHSIAWRASTSVAKSTVWGTPPAIYLPLDREFEFSIDIAASPGNAKHPVFVTKDTDALTIPWAGHKVFCNPPYGRNLRAWLTKGFEEASDHGALCVFLIPARTDAGWFHDICLPHAEIRFIRGRLSYVSPNQTDSRERKRAPFPSMIVIFRPYSRGEGRIDPQHVFPFMPKVI